MLKKILILLTALVLTFSMSGCFPLNAVKNAFVQEKEIETVIKENVETKEPVKEEPTTEEPTTEKPTTKEQVTEEPATKDPGPKTVEEFYSNPVQEAINNAQLKQLKEYYASLYSDINFGYVGNTVIYEYTYLDELDPEIAFAALDATFTPEVIQEMLVPIEEETGISDVELQIIFNNPDGTEIFNKTYTR
ncbi:MAG: DUF4854 domain-containing protein [Butyrivibrio sp.]